MKFSEGSVDASSTHEQSLSSQEVRRGLFVLLTQGPLAPVIQGMGIVLTLNGATGCLSVQRRPEAVVQPISQAHTSERTPEHALTTEEQKAYLIRLFGAPFPLDDDPPSPERESYRQSFPGLYGFERYAGYSEQTLKELLRRGYPRFMVRGSNVHTLSFSSVRRAISREYGPILGGMMEAGDAPRSGPRLASRVIFRRDVFSGTDPVQQTRYFVITVSHELAHASDPYDIDTLPPEERVQYMYRLATIATDPARRVPFFESEHVQNPDAGREHLLRTQEYHAEAIAGALDTPVGSGGDWRLAYRTQIMQEYGVSAEVAQETADYAIGYILRNDPEYDQQRGYAVRKRSIGLLAQQRAMNLPLTREVLREIDAGDQRWQDHESIRRRVCLRFADDHIGLFPLFSGDGMEEIVSLFSDPYLMEHFIFDEAPVGGFPRAQQIPPGLSSVSGRHMTEAWLAYIEALRVRSREYLRDLTVPTGQISGEALTQQALIHLQSAVHEGVSHGVRRQVFEAWALRVFQERFGGESSTDD